MLAAAARTRLLGRGGRRKDLAWEYQRRALLYGQWDDCLNAKTHFFAAASVTNSVLGYLAMSPRAALVLKTSLPWLSSLGAALQTSNVWLAEAVGRGEIDGPHLDQKIVSIEQYGVEWFLRASQNRSVYPMLISELDALLNQYNVLAALHGSAAVRWYGRVIASVRAELRAPLQFERQDHREAIGLSLIRGFAGDGAPSLA